MSRSTRRLAVLAILATGVLFGYRATAVAAEQTAPAADAPTALAPFVHGKDAKSPLWWLARAEEEAIGWGNPHEQAWSFSEIASVLADAGQIEPAVAVAKRIELGSALVSTRYRIAAAYARAGKLQVAKDLGMLTIGPFGPLEEDSYVEIHCHIAIALAKAGRVKEAERGLAALEQRPAGWPGQWTPPNSLDAVLARIHAAIAAAEAKAGRREACQEHIREAESLAAGIPNVDASQILVLGSSTAPLGGDRPNPMFAIHKFHAIVAVMHAHAEAGNEQAAENTLDLIEPGRFRDATARQLVEQLAQRGKLKAAYDLAGTVETQDHGSLAYLSILAAHTKAGELGKAEALLGKIRGADNRAIAQMHLATAAGRVAENADRAELPDTAANRREEAARRELQARAAGGGQQSLPPIPAATPRYRGKTYRTLAQIQAPTRSPRELLTWIRGLPRAEAQFYAFLGVGETLPISRDSQ